MKSWMILVLSLVSISSFAMSDGYVADCEVLKYDWSKEKVLENAKQKNNIVTICSKGRSVERAACEANLYLHRYYDENEISYKILSSSQSAPNLNPEYTGGIFFTEPKYLEDASFCHTIRIESQGQ